MSTLSDYYISDDPGRVVQRYLHLSAAMAEIKQALVSDSWLQFLLSVSSGHGVRRFEPLIPDVLGEPPALKEYRALCDGVLILLRKYLEAASTEIAEELRTEYGIDASVTPGASFTLIDRSL